MQNSKNIYIYIYRKVNIFEKAMYDRWEPIKEALDKVIHCIKFIYTLLIIPKM